MDAFAEAALSFVERCQTHTDMKSLMADFEATIKLFGFGHFMMARRPPPAAEPEPLIIAQNWSIQWLARYRDQAYFWSDPVSHHLFAPGRPFTWREARERSQPSKAASQIEDEARSAGMVDGLGFPVSDPASAQSAVSLASNQAVDLAVSAKALLHTVCIYCDLRAAELVGQAAEPRPKLTPREREVLQWIANGKSAWETSVIVHSAEKTVERQLVGIRQKLQASNTTQAVAKAVASRQIHI